MSTPPDALIVTRRDIRRVMLPSDYLEAVELGFRAGAMGKANSPHPMHLPVARGGFHAKGASISLGRDYVAVKINGNFPGNPAKHGLPTIQGAIFLADGSNGAVLAIIDSVEVTIQRTAAASALAAKLLTRSDSTTLLICGCGEQGRAHAAAMREVLPITRCLLWDRESEVAEALAAELDGMAVQDLNPAAEQADVIACCTTARTPYLDLQMVRPGTFIAAVGADNPDKSEIAPALMASATVVTDATTQCAEMGDLHHAIEAGSMMRSDVHAELGQLLVGEKAGRTSPDEIIIFDSTGTGLQDVAVAAAIYERFSGDASIQSVAFSAL
jgi:ornithine cyclodeaminase/alanine dehydrogenase-like protein (mu-crystallin family)